MINAAGIPAERVYKDYEGRRPNIRDYLLKGKVQLLINSPIRRESKYDDSYLRKDAIKERVPYITTLAGARAAAEGIRDIKFFGRGRVHSLQEWHSLIR